MKRDGGLGLFAGDIGGGRPYTRWSVDDEPPENTEDLEGEELLATAEAKQAAGLPLSKREQMALYEKALKEDDWGHQPC